MISIDLTGKLALVTGATGELGAPIARALAAAGADVVVNYLQNQAVADQVCEEIRRTGRRALAWQADVCSRDAIERMRKGVGERLGSPDIIVTNAVIQYSPWRSVLDQPEDAYRSQFSSSVLQNVFMAQAFVPAMIEKQWGRMIGINTECAMQCWENQSAYVSGKRGMDGVLRVLAKEVGRHNITVNQVAPGWIASENRPEEDTPHQNTYRENVPLKRRGSPQDVANSVAFLASDLARFTTGLYFTVCGGNVMPTI